MKAKCLDLNFRNQGQKPNSEKLRLRPNTSAFVRPLIYFLAHRPPHNKRDNKRVDAHFIFYFFWSVLYFFCTYILCILQVFFLWKSYNVWNILQISKFKTFLLYALRPWKLQKITDRCILWSILTLTIKVSKNRNDFMKTLFLPKYQRISALASIKSSNK